MVDKGWTEAPPEVGEAPPPSSPPPSSEESAEETPQRGADEITRDESPDISDIEEVEPTTTSFPRELPLYEESPTLLVTRVDDQMQARANAMTAETDELPGEKTVVGPPGGPSSEKTIVGPVATPAPKPPAEEPRPATRSSPTASAGGFPPPPPLPGARSSPKVSSSPTAAPSPKPQSSPKAASAPKPAAAPVRTPAPVPKSAPVVTPAPVPKSAPVVTSAPVMAPAPVAAPAAAAAPVSSPASAPLPLPRVPVETAPASPAALSAPREPKPEVAVIPPIAPKVRTAAWPIQSPLVSPVAAPFQSPSPAAAPAPAPAVAVLEPTFPSVPTSVTMVDNYGPVSTLRDALLGRVRVANRPVPLWAVLAPVLVVTAMLAALFVGVLGGSSSPSSEASPVPSGTGEPGDPARASAQATGAKSGSLTLVERAATGEPTALSTLEKKKAGELGTDEALAIARGKVAQDAVAAKKLRERLAADPGLAKDRKVIADLVRFAHGRETSGDALATMAALPGPLSADLVYEVWTGTAERSDATELARAILLGKDVRPKASPALSVALELREATTCEQSLALLTKAIETGDKRALVPINRLARKTGCGPNKRQDCYPCLRDGDIIKRAFNAVRVRREPELLR